MTSQVHDLRRLLLTMEDTRLREFSEGASAELAESQKERIRLLLQIARGGSAAEVAIWREQLSDLMAKIQDAADRFASCHLESLRRVVCSLHSTISQGTSFIETTVQVDSDVRSRIAIATNAIQHSQRLEVGIRVHLNANFGVPVGASPNEWLHYASKFGEFAVGNAFVGLDCDLKQAILGNAAQGKEAGQLVQVSTLSGESGQFVANTAN